MFQTWIANMVCKSQKCVTWHSIPTLWAKRSLALVSYCSRSNSIERAFCTVISVVCSLKALNSNCVYKTINSFETVQSQNWYTQHRNTHFCNQPLRCSRGILLSKICKTYFSKRVKIADPVEMKRISEHLSGECLYNESRMFVACHAQKIWAFVKQKLPSFIVWKSPKSEFLKCFHTSFPVPFTSRVYEALNLLAGNFQAAKRIAGC